MEQTDQALKTVIMVGRTEVGKTTLANTLMYGSPEARKLNPSAALDRLSTHPVNL